MDTTTVVDQLNNFNLSTVRSSLLNWEGVDPAKIEQTLLWVDGLRRDLVTLVREIDDASDIEMSLAIAYIEMKSRWIALNTRINYATFRRGACEQGDALRGNAVSLLLGHIESMLNQGDIEQISMFLAQPINQQAA